MCTGPAAGAHTAVIMSQATLLGYYSKASEPLPPPRPRNSPPPPPKKRPVGQPKKFQTATGGKETDTGKAAQKVLRHKHLDHGKC